MNRDLKEAINSMQFHIDKSSSKVLLIFDNEYLKKSYLRNNDKSSNDEICITTTDLCYKNTLSGLRFKAFYFMR